MPGCAASASTSSPESSASAGRPAALGRGQRLDLGIGRERGAGLLGLGQAQVGRRDHREPERPDQLADLAHLAGVVARDDEACAGVQAAGHSQFPDARLGELQAVAGRVAEIDRAAAARPFEVGLDGDALGPAAARASRRSRRRGARKQMWPGPRAPCGGTGRAPGAGGISVASGLKTSSTWSPQRKKMCRPAALANGSSPSTSR